MDVVCVLSMIFMDIYKQLICSLGDLIVLEYIIAYCKMKRGFVLTQNLVSMWCFVIICFVLLRLSCSLLAIIRTAMLKMSWVIGVSMCKNSWICLKSIETPYGL